jgi:hypothetical protein
VPVSEILIIGPQIDEYRKSGEILRKLIAT